MPPLSTEERESVNWLDQQLIQTSWPMLIALTALFFGLMWIFSGIALLLTKHPLARKKAKILLTVCTAYAVFVGLAVFGLIRSGM